MKLHWNKALLLDGISYVTNSDRSEWFNSYYSGNTMLKFDYDNSFSSKKYFQFDIITELEPMS